MELPDTEVIPSQHIALNVYLNGNDISAGLALDSISISLLNSSMKLC